MPTLPRNVPTPPINPFEGFFQNAANLARQGGMTVANALLNPQSTINNTVNAIGAAANSQPAKNFAKGYNEASDYQNPTPANMGASETLGNMVGSPIDPAADVANVAGQFIHGAAPAIASVAPVIAGMKLVDHTAPDIKTADSVVTNGAKMSRDMRFKQGNPAFKTTPAAPLDTTVQTATGAKTTPLNPNAEQLPINNTSAGSPSIPHPEIPIQPEDISAQRTNNNPITGGSPVLVDLRNQAAKNPYYLQDQTNAQNVLNKHVPGNTPMEVEQNLPIKLGEETKRIQNIIGSDPKTVPVNDIIAQNEVNMQKAGIVPGSNTTGEQASKDLVKDLNSQLNAGNQNIAPIEQANGNDLLKYKNLLDDRLQSVYKKIDNGTSLTPTENATLTFRRTIDNALTNLYPTTKEALNRQSAMIDARPSVAKAAGDQQGELLKNYAPPVKPSLVDTIKKYALPGAIITDAASRLGVNPAQAASTALGWGSQGLNNLEDAFSHKVGNTQPNSQIGQASQEDKNSNNVSNIHSSSISNPINNVNSIPNLLTDVQGGNDNYTIQSPDTITGSDGASTVGLSYASYQKKYNQLIKQKSDPAYLNNQYFKQQVDNSIDALSTKYNDPSNVALNKAYAQDSATEHVINTAQQQLTSVAPELSQAFGSGQFSYDAMRNASDPKYDALKQSFNNIIAAYPAAADMLSKAKTQQGVMKIIKSVHANLLNDYYSQISGAEGGVSPSGNVPDTTIQTPPDTTSQAAPAAPGFHFTGGSVNPNATMPQFSGGQPAIASN
jgi:hypothetical protein